MKITTVLLDVDGTLLDSNDAHTQAWQRALASVGHSVPYGELRPLIGKGGDKLLKEVVGIDDESAEGQRISEERKRIFSQHLLSCLQPTVGARALLERLLADGFQLAVATSSSGEELKALLQQAGVDGLIPVSATASDAESSKPDPDIVEAALRKTGARADSTILIGDTPHDIEAAQRAGVLTVALRCGGAWDDQALAAAAAIYDDPADLLQHLAESPLTR